MFSSNDIERSGGSRPQGSENVTRFLRYGRVVGTVLGLQRWRTNVSRE